jgi:hypothetical protein
MKTFYWILAFGLTILLMQYSLFKENGEPRQISLPVAVAK